MAISIAEEMLAKRYDISFALARALPDPQQT